MLATLEATTPRRRAMRRSVKLECAAQSQLWDDSAPFTATDLSPFGIWLSTQLPLEIGAEVTLSFRPPQWPVWAWPVTVRAEVVRVGMPRRRSDEGMAGMGLCFLDLDRLEAERMAELLRGLPPPLPKPVAVAAGLPQPVVLFEASEIDLVTDGACFQLSAEAPLLTVGWRKPVTRAQSSRAAYKLARAKHRTRRRAGLGRRRRVREDVAPPPRRPRLRLVS